MTFWHTKRPKHTSTLLPHDFAFPLIEHDSGNSCCRTPLIKHNPGNTHCAVGKKSDHHDSPLNNIALANHLTDTVHSHLASFVCVM